MPKKKSRKRRSRRRSHNRRRNRPVSLFRNPSSWTADLFDTKPRITAIYNLATLFILGLCAGLLIGAIVAFGTSQLPNKLWIYMMNTAIALLVKIVWAWLWVLFLQNLVIKISARASNLSFNQLNAVRSSELPDQANRTVLIITIITAFSTILATEEIRPEWLSEPIHIIWSTGVVGAITAMLDSLSIPGNIFAMLHNRHHYQNNGRQGKRRG